MGNMLVFVRHGKTKIDKNVPVADWILAEQGEKEAQEIANSPTFEDVNVLISSSEEKAYLTIKPLADRLHKEIIRIPELGEIKRPNSEKLTLEEYEDMKVKIFKDLNFTDHGWETANHALERFKTAVEKIDKQYKNQIILICSHGTVMTLYFAYLKDEMDKLFDQWESLGFGSYGIVENGKVTRDIVRDIEESL